MTGAHVALAWLVAASLGAVLVVAVMTAVQPARGSYRWLDATLLAHGLVTGVTSLVGMGALLTGRPPADTLHLLYGAVATLGPLLTRAAAQGRGARTIGRWIAVAAVVAIGATVRSFMTGR